MAMQAPGWFGDVAKGSGTRGTEPTGVDRPIRICGAFGSPYSNKMLFLMR